MPRLSPSPDLLRALTIDIRTLGVAALGGGAFWLAGIPMAALTGAAVAVTLAALIGLPVALSRVLRNACFLILGLNIGAGITPEVVATAPLWLPSLAALGVMIWAMLLIGAKILERLYGLDRASAVLAASPGHLSYVLAYAEDRGLALDRVALIQSIRVLLLALVVPLPVTWLAGPEAGPVAGGVPMALTALGLLALAGAATGWLFGKLRLPAAILLGGMAASGLAHGSALVVGVPPGWMVQAAFLGMGALIGSRFHGTTWGDLRRLAGAGIVLTAMASAVALLGALALAWLLSERVGLLFVAYAPGGVEAMAAVALQLGYAPAVVAAHHVARLLILSILVPLMMPKRRENRTPPPR